METRKHLAAEKNRQKTHNCAQAVLCTYCDLCGLDPKTAEDIAGSFGMGMGNMEGTCGSLVGAGMVLGLVTKDRNLARKRMKQVMQKFQERNGATQCRKLKGVDTGRVLRDCPDCVADAAEFLEAFLPEPEPQPNNHVLKFVVEEIYRDYERTGSVVLSDEEMDRLIQYLHEADGETSLYTSDMETCCPDIFQKIDEAAILLMAEMDALIEERGEVGMIDEKYPYGQYRVDILIEQ